MIKHPKHTCGRRLRGTRGNLTCPRCDRAAARKLVLTKKKKARARAKAQVDIRKPIVVSTGPGAPVGGMDGLD